jgi:hypothetical protein
MGHVRMVRVHARVQQQHCIAIRKEMSAEAVKAARLSGDACSVLIQRRRPGNMHFAHVNQEVLGSRAHFASCAPTQPVLAALRRHRLGTERKRCSFRRARDIARHIFGLEMADGVSAPHVLRRAIHRCCLA